MTIPKLECLIQQVIAMSDVLHGMNDDLPFHHKLSENEFHGPTEVASTWDKYLYRKS